MKKKYTITGIDCANCAAKLESKMNELPEVEQVVLTYATQQLLVEAEDIDAALPKLRELAEKMEPETVIEELTRGKRKSQKTEKKSCCCGENHHEHTHEHEHCDCGGHHHAHEHEHCDCGGHHHAHEHEHCDCGGHHHAHEHEHCDCGGHHHAHEHEHCDCGGHHHAHEHEHCDCGGHHHDYKHEHCGCEGHHHHDIKEKEASVKEKQPLSGEKKEGLLILAGALFLAAGIFCKELMVNTAWLSIGMFVVGYLILGGEVVLTAFKNILKGKVFDENFLMSIATIGAFFIGEYPEAVGVMLFYRVGELFEDIAVNKSRKQILEAVDMRPEIVRVEENGVVKEYEPEDVEVGQIIEVRPGDRIPLDGVVVRGESRVDTSAVTGEPVPVAVRPGKQVVSGCVNTSGILYIKVEKLLEESMVTRILEAVENAAASKPKIDRFITRFARVYTPLVVVVATATAIIPSLVTGNWEYWIYTALTFLVISCPCALVLSVPLAFFAGIGAGSKKGILFKGGASLEMLSKIKAVVMDKTGTITEGNFIVERVDAEEGISQEEVLALAAVAESRSTHPIAISIREAAKERNIEIAIPEGIQEISGKGMIVEKEGSRIICGNRKLLEMNQIAVKDSKNDAGTEVFVAKDGKYLGRIVINDILKEDSKQAVEEMNRQGLWTVMLTGDTEENAEKVAKQVGIRQNFSRQLPEDKLKNLGKIREEKGAVLFIGDGINDAPVLAGADVGAAMGSGADAAIEAADVVFMTSRLSAVNDSFDIARRTSRVAIQNVIGALAIKALVMVLGFFGIASMWMAVFADSGVAMLCVLNAIRILYSHKG